ncbi:MAG: P-II family nitrogen regulator [Desulfovibrio sp.]|jgi:nitrogen regulatory protein P-II 1|nr:P-II family nitrogen regulator [Desulfovibrio sp.]
MKLLIGYIRPEALNSVKEKLYADSIFAMSVTNVLGAGQQKGYTELYRGVQTEVNLLKKLRIEICLPDEKVDAAMDAITAGARTEKEGDGVIFVLDVSEGRRIRTGEPLA